VIRVLHVITGLGVGGAETLLYRLLGSLDRNNFSGRVVSLTEKGPLAEKIEKLGVPVTALGMKRGPGGFLAWARLFRLIRSERPHVVQTWMYHSDFFGGLAAKRAGVPVVWGIHQSNISPEVNKRTTLVLVRLGARLSRTIPAKIVCTSEAARRVHASAGYAADRLETIPVGFDTELFRPDPGARARLRRAWNVPDDAVLIGMAARRDPQKDHENFFSAASILAAQDPRARFVLCGKGMESPPAGLEKAVADRCRFLGPVEDMASFYSALDIATLSSRGEGFPTVLGEAMLCEVPVAATDAGDSALLVGETGKIAPIADPVELAKIWRVLIEDGPEGRRQRGRQARRRIIERFSLPSIARLYQDLYRAVLRTG
jgi:glycosyltransferase involved in cell wall biosynthesis